jgi:hypothetical protein
MNWIINNTEWIFSGIGVAIISFIIGLFLKNKSTKKLTMKQKSGNNSTNIQVGGNCNVEK